MQTELNDERAEAELQIDHVVSRGARADAQVLLVVASTARAARPGEDVWVALGDKAPQTMRADQNSDGIEACRRLERNELGTFGVADPDPQRHHWLARFDLSDHAWLEQHWRWLCGAAAYDETARLHVTAWRSQAGAPLDPQGKRWETSEPQPDPARAAIALDDIEAQHLFELGVLFVHGIGPHQPRETLVHWAEPLVRFWRDRARAIGVAAAAGVTWPDRQHLHDALWHRQLRNRAPLDGIVQALDDFVGAPCPAPDAPTAWDEKGRICVASVRPEQTVFKGADADQPSAALWRMSTIDDRATLRESHVLLAESYWTQELFPPTFAELFSWLTTAIPVTVWVRVQALLREGVAALREFEKRPSSRFDRLRLGLKLATSYLRLLVLPGWLVLWAWSGQIVIGLVGLFGLLAPIPVLRSGARTLMNVLLGTVGQSQAFQTSPVRRSAVVSAVESRLDWLSAQCRQVVVMSHSQGAEVSRRVFSERRRPHVCRWYTFGAGIVPLDALSPKNLDRPASKVVVWVSRVTLLGLVLPMLVALVDRVPGLQFGAWQWLAEAAESVGWLGAASGYWVLTVAALAMAIGCSSPPFSPRLRASMMAKWHDLYASDDPVPGGSLFARIPADLDPTGVQLPREDRIFNTRFSLLDHTGYFRNLEQFVAPIALDLLRFMGIGGDEPLESATLKAAARQRELLTWWTMLAVFSGLVATFAVCLWMAFGPLQRGPAWWHAAQSLWSRPVGWSDRLALLWSEGHLGHLAHDLRFAAAVLLVLGALLLVRLGLGQRMAKSLVRCLADAARQPPPPTMPRQP